MTLFNYKNCTYCKNNNNDFKIELSKIMPVNVCDKICEYNVSCSKCRSLHLKEVEFMEDKELPDEGLEKFELQLDFFRKMMCSHDPMEFHTQGHPNIMYFHYDKYHRKRIDRLFDENCVKKRFKDKRMYYQAIKSYCKNNVMEVLKILSECISIKNLKECKRRGGLPNLNSYWEYRGYSYYMRNILSCLIELYTDALIEYYEDYCCQSGLWAYSNWIAVEVEYGSNSRD